MVDYQEVSGMNYIRIHYLSKFLKSIKTQQMADDFLNNNMSIIMELPIILREGFLKGAQRHRDKLNETEGK